MRESCTEEKKRSRKKRQNLEERERGRKQTENIQAAERREMQTVRGRQRRG